MSLSLAVSISVSWVSGRPGFPKGTVSGRSLKVWSTKIKYSQWIKDKKVSNQVGTLNLTHWTTLNKVCQWLDITTWKKIYTVQGSCLQFPWRLWCLSESTLEGNEYNNSMMFFSIFSLLLPSARSDLGDWLNPRRLDMRSGRLIFLLLSPKTNHFLRCLHDLLVAYYN